MTPDRIKYLIAQGESENLEFKLSHNNEVIETISAFANSKGGSVIIGVSNSGDIRGVQINEESIQNWINEVKQKTEPSIIPDAEMVQVDNFTVVIFYVQEYPVKPIAFKGRYYKRVKNSNHELSVNEITNLHLHSLQVSWDSYGFPDYKIEQLSTEKIRKFVKELNETGRFNTNEADLVILKKLSLIKEEKPTIASVLLFAKEPERYHIRIGRFKSESSILDDRQITDTLFEASEESLKFVKNYIQIAYGFEGNLKRTERWEYPVEAIKESLLNAIVHRDYKNTNDIQIKIFDDRISIFSPGKLYGNLLIEDLKDNNYQSNLRNKLIAEAFYLTGKIEKYGTGFIRIREALKDYPTISFNFEEFSDGFLITYTKKSDKDVTKGVTKGVTKDVTKDDISLRFNHIIDLIKKDNTITIDEIAKSLEINRRTIIRYINKLKADKRIGREEGRKSGYWKVYE